MTNILLTLSYDGTDFCGWQRQDGPVGRPAVRTVQAELEAALRKMLGHEVAVQGSGRTDSGVHAMAQAATFMSPVDSVPPGNYARALNGLLPQDIRVSASQQVDDGFNARFSATSRTYRYFMHTGSVPPASMTRYVWPLPYRPDADVLNAMCAALHGETDCATFAASGDQSRSTNRYIEDARFWYDTAMPSMLVFQIQANAFLWRMVRSLTGTFIALERAGKTAADFERVLRSCDRKQAGPTAIPQGLFLWHVSFDGLRRH